MRAKEEVDVVVIGSGFGGLACAGLLARSGRQVLVCESHTAPGGARMDHPCPRWLTRFDGMAMSSTAGQAFYPDAPHPSQQTQCDTCSMPWARTEGNAKLAGLVAIFAGGRQVFEEGR
ncbi:unnamed protein product [Effrenium voratum]|nr:unnamed protein product [Effrenium voratum]